MKRPLLILLGLAVAAVVALVLLRRDRGPDLTLGGPLFAVDPATVEGVLVTKQGIPYRFDRLADGGWTLAGGASDYIDAGAMDALVEVLPTAAAGALLPGTEPEDRRYGFNGPDAIRVRLFLTGGDDVGVAIGTMNPVTGNYYASGAGRSACFPIAGALREKLNMLPRTVQAKTLLPPFDRDAVRAVRLLRSGTPHDLARGDGSWWLRLDPAQRATSLAALPQVVRDYQALYADRRRTDDAGTWILADDVAVEQMIYEVSETVVREILPPRETAARSDEWQLAPPWREVDLLGEALNPDPSAPDADRMVLTFGPPVTTDRVPVLRRGNVLLTDEVALTILGQGVDVLAHQRALVPVARSADRVDVVREGAQVLVGTRTGEARTPEGRFAWRAEFPPLRDGLDEKDRHGFVQDLVVDLNRIPILAVLPPTDDPAVLAPAGRTQVTLTWNGPEGEGRHLVFETGLLQTGHLPDGAGPLVRTPDAAVGPVGLWFPATGQLFQVPATLYVTARSLAPLAAAAGDG